MNDDLLVDQLWERSAAMVGVPASSGLIVAETRRRRPLTFR